MKILVLDNYDSFTYNLVHIIRRLGHIDQTAVYRNDKISLDDVAAYDKILLSPGPGVPKDAGIMPALLQQYSPSKSILGVCLGHQAIGEAFGGSIFNMSEVLHGVATNVQLDTSDVLFYGLRENVTVCRYHSWAIDRASLPTGIKVTAEDDAGQVMAIAHEQYDVRGVQFHPESILTEHGEEMINNWLKG
ncbi:MAG: aminodeoxychorismate/anthranilate synthase component II [Cyclobacteriaceae bacterium]